MKGVGLLCGLALPLLGLLGTALAVVTALVLESQGRRRDSFLVAGVAFGALLAVLLLTYPVHSSGIQVTKH